MKPGAMTTTVRSLLKDKGHKIVTIDGEATVLDAVEMMVSHKVGSVVVVDGETVRGIFTERDYMRRVALRERHPRTTAVQEVMTTDLDCVGLDDSLDECMTTMTQQRCRHLPVREGAELVGLVSIGDCVARVCDELSAENCTLYEYIGGYWYV